METDASGSTEHQDGRPDNEASHGVPALLAAPSGVRGVFVRTRENLRSLSLKSVLSGLTTAATIISSVGIVVALIWQIGLEGFDRSLEVEPISVPKSIEEDGYTPSVVAQRLDDAMARIMIDATTNMKRHKISTYSETAAAVNSGSTTSLGIVISSVLHFLHLSARTYVSGEITRRDQKYWMTLRISGQDKVLCSLGPATNVDDLFVSAARRVLWDTQPYIVASYDYTRNPKLALAEANAIPEWLPRRNENVLRAINLKGLIFQEIGRFGDAEDAFRKVLDTDPSFGVARWNLGLLMLREARFDDAEHELKQAFEEGYPPSMSLQKIDLLIALERRTYQERTRPAANSGKIR